MPKVPVKKRNLNSVRGVPSSEPAWRGPDIDGVTQSILCDYMCCRERFRVTMVEGLVPFDRFNVAIEFGHMWHICEEYHAGNRDWVKPLTMYAAELSQKYRTEQSHVLKWYNVVKLYFPIYVDYWQHQSDEQNRVPLMQEYCFKINYELPSKRWVNLRGKMDGVDYIDGLGIFLQENKTKSKIDVEGIGRQLLNDMQVMTYLIALDEYKKDKGPSSDNPYMWEKPIAGVRYNVVRRPLSGGRGSIRPHKARGNKPGESMDEFYERLTTVIEDDADYYFSRWQCLVSEQDIVRFKEQTFHPVIENLCDDYEWWSYCHKAKHNHYDYDKRAVVFPEHRNRHFRLPYGPYNVVLQGGFSEVDDYLNDGSRIGLRTCTNFFPEL
jgi:hypothetical protein